LLIIGAVALFAAIVGGGIKIQQIEVGSVQSKWRQWLLAAFGLVIGFIGLIMVLPDDKLADAAGNVAAADENAAASNAIDNTSGQTNAVDTNSGEDYAGDNVVDANVAEPPAEDPDQAAPAEENAAQ
jgi:predicted phage tail protein